MQPKLGSESCASVAKYAVGCSATVLRSAKQQGEGEPRQAQPSVAKKEPTMALAIFWGAVSLIIYTYILFPILTMIRGAFWPREHHSIAIAPSVSLIIAAYNEADSIRAKLENVLALVYPRDSFEVLVASDGSTDGTNEIVREYEDRGIRLLALPRQGKAGALNDAVAVAKGDILVFSDANSMYDPDAIQELVRPFADLAVGGVAGNQCYSDDMEDGRNAGEHSYWNFDRLMKEFQSRSGNAISATGAIYAIRRSLFDPVPGGVTDDFTISTGVIEKGYRLVFASAAQAFEPASSSNSDEFGRKVRIITRGLRAVIVRRKLLNPFRYGFYSFQLFSHKVLRRLVVIPLLLLLVINPLLVLRSVFYQATMLAQLVFYGMAVVGFYAKSERIKQNKLITIPAFFCMVNGAALMATINVLRGHRIERWEPKRVEVETSETADAGGIMPDAKGV